jgi:hypothetical protein
MLLNLCFFLLLFSSGASTAGAGAAAVGQKRSSDEMQYGEGIYVGYLLGPALVMVVEPMY